MSKTSPVSSDNGQLLIHKKFVEQCTTTHGLKWPVHQVDRTGHLMSFDTGWFTL